LTTHCLITSKANGVAPPIGNVINGNTQEKSGEENPVENVGGEKTKTWLLTSAWGEHIKGGRWEARRGPVRNRGGLAWAIPGNTG